MKQRHAICLQKAHAAGIAWQQVHISTHSSKGEQHDTVKLHGTHQHSMMNEAGRISFCLASAPPLAYV
jgi:hypothetical protein